MVLLFCSRFVGVNQWTRQPRQFADTLCANGTSSVFVGFNSRLESLNCTDVVHGVWQQESGSQAKDAGE